MTLTAAFHVNHAEHQRIHGEAMRRGLERHGIRCEFHPHNTPAPCDFAVIWGYRQQRVIAAGRPILVMERGHLPDRFFWTSCGWATPAGGVGRRARYASADDGGARFHKHWGHLVQPWRGAWYPDRPILVCGQVPGDVALGGIDIDAWAQRVTDDVLRAGGSVRFRPHPFLVRQGRPLGMPHGAVLSLNPQLEDDLALANLVVTYNSTTAVETVLAGVYTVAMHEGSMAWDVTAHKIYGAAADQPRERDAWANRLAWCQWSLDEIRAGIVWEHLGAMLKAA